jgi:hypothetical protein
MDGIVLMDTYPADPADAYADYNAIDGHNWGGEYGTWQSFDRIFLPAWP